MRVLCFHSAQVKAKEENISTYADGARFGSCTTPRYYEPRE